MSHLDLMEDYLGVVTRNYVIIIKKAYFDVELKISTWIRFTICRLASLQRRETFCTDCIAQLFGTITVILTFCTKSATIK